MDIAQSFTVRRMVLAMTLLASGALLFARLGHYALWDDESYTALAGRAVCATGDTGAVVGHNIVGFRGGLVLRNMKDRATPPLPAYVVAPMVGLLGGSTFIVRLPFAICGLATVLIMLRWASRETSDNRALVVLSLAILGNVSFFLYCRQCRYYGLSLFLVVLIAYIYAYFDGRRSKLIVMLLASMALLATNYIHYVAMYGALAIDYLIWGRRRYRWNIKQLAILLGPQLVFGAIVGAIWNPLYSSGSYGNPVAKTWFQRFASIWIMTRDSNRNDFGVMYVLVVAPLMFLWKRNHWLLRAPLAVIPFIVAAAILAPGVFPVDTPISQIPGDIRYVIPIIPICMGLSALVLWLLCGRLKWVAVLLAVPVFMCNALNRLSAIDYHVGCTPLKYVSELLHPPLDPYSATSQWINDHVEANASIWVTPNYPPETAGYQTYPLMYHAPQAIYAWQFPDPPAPEFKYLPDIQIAGRVMPDYIIAFGPAVFELIRQFRPAPGVAYEQVATLDVFWKDLYRPELMWRSFKPIPADATHGTAIYIFKKRNVPMPTTTPPATPQPSPYSDFKL